MILSTGIPDFNIYTKHFKMTNLHFKSNAHSAFDRIENIVRKGEHVGNQRYLLFP